MKEYDIIVVGAGLIGSAAARHLVDLSNNLKVLLIGPEEPQDRNSTDIFGAHYDEGRITKALDRDPVWGTLVQRSIANYRDLEQQSRIPFYYEVGCLVLGEQNGEYINDVKPLAAELKEEISVLDSQQLNQQFPYIGECATIGGVYSAKNAGHISPRNLIRAQQVLAKRNGCDVINDIVKTITAIGSGEFQVEAEDSGDRIRGKKVLLAAGCFIHARELLPYGLQLKFDLYGITVLLAEVDPSQIEMHGLWKMPFITSDGHLYERKLDEAMDTSDLPDTDPNPEEKEASEEAKMRHKCYILPPIKYPDGKYYIKVGHREAFRVPLQSSHEMVQWYRHEHSNTHNTEQVLKNMLHAYLPDVVFKSYKYDYCVNDVTETRQIYIDLIDPRFGVVVGGNGNAAKSSDEIGKIAARLIMRGIWEYDIPATTFKAKWKR